MERPSQVLATQLMKAYRHVIGMRMLLQEKFHERANGFCGGGHGVLRAKQHTDKTLLN
jgi:hypothetical protein